MQYLLSRSYRGQPLPWFITACALCGVLLLAWHAAPAASPVSADESLEHFHLADGLVIELVAAEPEVVDPIDVRFDEQGRMWVVEMRDYPTGPAPGETPRSCIRRLEDHDGDGRYETSTLFADGLLFATGLQPWRGGVIVTLAGRVAYLRDTDGDGRADQETIWYTGFAEQNSQLRANHPRLALDGTVYVANGLRGGRVMSNEHDQLPPVEISGRDFRFDPRDRRVFEAVTGDGQFGLTFDDFGRRFVCSNRNPLRQVVLEDRYLRRNPVATIAATVTDVAAEGAASRVFPLVNAWTTSNLHAGQFTAACGVETYRGDALPNVFHGAAFICEPTGALVHCEILESVGPVFRSHPWAENREFLASTDPWFRPVNLAVGPDGALYVVDMYRAVIEHPEWMPTELQARPDLMDGHDRGRIYRIRAKHRILGSRQPSLANATSAELVATLEDDNVWRRETAARLLLEGDHHDRAAQRQLVDIARQGDAPTARVHALWLLKHNGLLSDDVLLTAIEDPDSRVQEQALILAEDRMSHAPRLAKHAAELASTADARLRFQLALSLGAVDGELAAETLAEIAIVDAADVWTRRAVLTSLGDHPRRVFTSVLARMHATNRPSGQDQLVLVRELAAACGAASEEESNQAFQTLFNNDSTSAADATRQAALIGLAEGMKRRGAAVGAWLAKSDLVLEGHDELRRQLTASFVAAAGAATDNEASASARQDAIELLAHAPAEVALVSLDELLSRDAAPEIQLAAARALASRREPNVADLLLADLSSRTPALRGVLLDAMLTRAERVGRLLDEIEAGNIAAGELDPMRRRRLLDHSVQDIRERAVALLGESANNARDDVLKRYRAALTHPADPLRGRQVFEKNCAVCHRVASLGVDVGPDVSDTRTKTAEQLLIDILQPNRAIDANYVSYTIITTDGRQFVGLVAAETSTSITLRLQDAAFVTLARREVEVLHSAGISLMPVGLEANISIAEMADLLAFLKNWRYLDGAVPLQSATGAPPPAE